MAQVAVPLSLTLKGLLFIVFIETRTVNFFDLWLYFKGGVPTSFLLMSGDCWAVDSRHVSANRAMNISAICFKVHTDLRGICWYHSAALPSSVMGNLTSNHGFLNYVIPHWQTKRRKCPLASPVPSSN